MALVKSHSNYVLKRLHQYTNSGNIYERDITTIGGVDKFTAGQIPIYRSSNFILTINNENTKSKNYGSNAWIKNDVSGETWTESALEGLVISPQDDDVRIVLKQDFYDLREFSYYGSCTELIRGSITDIMNRFPGEMYVLDEDKARYYQTNVTGTGTRATTLKFGEHVKRNSGGEILYKGLWITDTTPGDDPVEFNGLTDRDLQSDDCIIYEKTPLAEKDGDYVVVDNPFGINVHTKSIPRDITANERKRWFADDGYKNYEIVNVNGDKNPFEFNGKTIDDKCYNVGDRMTLDGGQLYLSIGDINIYLYYGEGGEIVYMTDIANIGKHIRPNDESIADFFDSLDQFQKILLNQKTSPLYTATFQVIHENNFGYYNTIEKFTFPKTYGGYNISADSDDYGTYVGRLMEIATFYDERFCDNLFRSMTPESLKNFDFTRAFVTAQQEEYEESGERIKKTIRLWGREYDEIKSYIDAIRSISNITYDERGNAPNYFLSDLLDADGWDVKPVVPFSLERYDSNKERLPDGDEYTFNEEISSNNIQAGYYNHFTRNVSGVCRPYMTDKANIDGGFDGNGNTETNYTVWVDDCNRFLSLRKKYTTSKEYSFANVNNEFLRRLKFNSKALLRSKGTINGVEMLLSLFGLKSKRFCDLYHKALTPDYKIDEYSVQVSGLKDPWESKYQMNKFDWYNSKKLINYEYDSSVATDDNGLAYVSYQGLPVVSYKISDYFHNGYDHDEDVRLYPNFDRFEQLDGDPYYQMNGGWQAKYLDPNKNFMFTNDGDVVTNTLSGEVLYHETLRNVRNVQTIADLFKQPYDDLEDNMVYRVNNVSYKDYAFINGYPFELYTDMDGKRYVVFTVKNGYVNIPGKYGTVFAEAVTVLGSDYTDDAYYLEGLPDGYEIQAYYNPDGASDVEKFKLQGSSEYDSIMYFDTFINGKPGDQQGESGYTQYFQMVDLCEGSNTMFAKDVDGVQYGGWKQLKNTDTLYLKLSAINDYFNGNNPHNGKFVYDNGYAYLNNFRRLFGYALDNYLFDERCFDDYASQMDEIDTFGFDDIVDSNTPIYDKHLLSDRKVNAFASTYNNDGCFMYDYPKPFEQASKEEYMQNQHSGATRADMETYLDTKFRFVEIGPVKRFLGPKKEIERKESTQRQPKKFIAAPAETDMNTTNKTVNTKRIDVTFYLKTETWYSREGLCELRYIDEVIVPYMEQMIPSNAILGIRYKPQEEV